MSKPPSEADIIFNRASVALAESQRLVASWLPPPTASELANAKSEEDLEREEQELFTPVPELLGLGASIPKEGEIKRQKEQTDEILRRRLLGREYKKTQTGHVGGKSLPTPLKRVVDDSDDEGGRSSLGRSKQLQNGTAGMKGEAGLPTASQVRTKSGKYLDEVLARKSKKSKKKKRKTSHSVVPHHE